MLRRSAWIDNSRKLRVTDDGINEQGQEHKMQRTLKNKKNVTVPSCLTSILM